MLLQPLFEYNGFTWLLYSNYQVVNTRTVMEVGGLKEALVEGQLFPDTAPLTIRILSTSRHDRACRHHQESINLHFNYIEIQVYNH
jgi:hypothetical protein